MIRFRLRRIPPNLRTNPTIYRRCGLGRPGGAGSALWGSSGESAIARQEAPLPELYHLPARLSFVCFFILGLIPTAAWWAVVWCGDSGRGGMGRSARAWTIPTPCTLPRRLTPSVVWRCGAMESGPTTSPSPPPLHSPPRPPPHHPLWGPPSCSRKSAPQSFAGRAARKSPRARAEPS